jgi:hypothetical protein
MSRIRTERPQGQFYGKVHPLQWQRNQVGRAPEPHLGKSLTACII